jgi:Arc/MetJ-type ribon-helix-helix transcriptional regulator
VKISVSLPVDDIEFLDAYAREHQIGSRSGAVQHALKVLRNVDLGDAYEQAWDEWESSGEAEIWASTTADEIARA